MNIKNKLIFTTIILFSFFFIGNVRAADCSKYGCATCIYEAGLGTYTYDVKSNGDGTISVEFSKTSEQGTTIENKVNNSIFINKETNRVQCFPIYQKAESMPRGLKLILESEDDSNLTKLEASSSSTNNDLPLIDENSNAKVKSCDYSSSVVSCTATASSESDKVTYSCTGGYTLSNSEFEVSDFLNGTTCPSATLTCSSRGGNYCGLLKGGWEGTESETGDEINGDKVTEIEGSTSSESSGDSVSADCEGLLGNGEFYNWLQDAFDLIKLAGPILALVLGMMDFIKALASGEDDAKKKATSSFGKRLLAAVLLFLIPAILSFVLSLVDTLGGGTCGIS